MNDMLSHPLTDADIQIAYAKAMKLETYSVQAVTESHKLLEFARAIWQIGFEDGQRNRQWCSHG